MHAADWVALGVGVGQVLAILATGGAAVYVANRQLAAFNDNQRLRNTLKALDDFAVPTTLQKVTLSPFDAILALRDIVGDPSDVRRFKSFPERRKNGDSSVATDGAWYNEARAKIAIATNYFLDIGMLWDRDLVDQKYVMIKLASFLSRFDDMLTTLGDPMTKVGSLKRFADIARSYQAAAAPEKSNT